MLKDVIYIWMKEVVLSNFIEQNLEQLSHKKRQTSIWSFVVFLISTLLFFSPLLFLGFLGYIVCIVLFVTTTASSEKEVTFKCGAEGEAILRKILRRTLSDEYTAYYGYKTNNNGDIDCIIVGPKGVFVIEVKHYKGIISYSEKTGWSHLKVGRRGTVYKGFLKDPGKQVMRNYWEIREKLRGINVPTYAVVVFTHPEAQLTVKGFTFGCDVLKVEQLPEFLESMKDTAREEDLSKVRALLPPAGRA
jgi:hypothetical protein